MVLEWEPTQTPDCHRIPLTLRQPLCHSQLPIQSRGSPKALLARKTLGIPSSEKTLRTAGFRPAKDGGVGTDRRGA